jgi:uncharacterized protein with NRDE domain
VKTSYINANDCPVKNIIDAARCSKCRQTQDLIYVIQNGRVYKTCNECRDRARRRRRPRVSITNRDSDDECIANANALLALSSSSADVPDINDVAVLIAAFGALSLSSSAAASSSSSADYVVPIQSWSLRS